MFFRKKKPIHQAELDMNNIPKHIGIIMDGNGRWAKRRGLPRSAGHKAGADVIERITDYCATLGVKVVTAYAFSTENWSRPEGEVNALMDLLYDYLIQVEDKFGKNDTKFSIIGDTSKFTPKIQEAMQHAIDVTKNGKKIILNLALNYGGRDEILRAAKKLCNAASSGELCVDDITEKTFSGFLDTSNMPEVDLIIRPSGEQRLSNFMLWQAAYAEFWYSDICWPDFKNEDMKQAIIDYQMRNRRFGGV